MEELARAIRGQGVREISYSTTICISEETRDKLKEKGKKGDTYEDILLRLMTLEKRKVRRKGVKKLRELGCKARMDTLKTI